MLAAHLVAGHDDTTDSTALGDLDLSRPRHTVRAKTVERLRASFPGTALALEASGLDGLLSAFVVERGAIGSYGDLPFPGFPTFLGDRHVNPAICDVARFELMKEAVLHEPLPGGAVPSDHAPIQLARLRIPKQVHIEQFLVDAPAIVAALRDGRAASYDRLPTNILMYRRERADTVLYRIGSGLFLVLRRIATGSEVSEETFPLSPASTRVLGELVKVGAVCVDEAR